MSRIPTFVVLMERSRRRIGIAKDMINFKTRRFRKRNWVAFMERSLLEDENCWNIAFEITWVENFLI